MVDKEKTEKPFALAIGYKSQKNHLGDESPVIVGFYTTLNQVVDAAYATLKVKSKKFWDDKDGGASYSDYTREAVCVVPYHFSIPEWENYKIGHDVLWPLKIDDIFCLSQATMKENELRKRLENRLAGNIKYNLIEDRPKKIAETLSSIYTYYDLEKICTDRINKDVSQLANTRIKIK